MANPVCDRPGCSHKLTAKMTKPTQALFCESLENIQITHYRCLGRPDSPALGPHYYHRGPKGEVCTHLAEAGGRALLGVYRVLDTTGITRQARSQIGQRKGFKHSPSSRKTASLARGKKPSRGWMTDEELAQYRGDPDREHLLGIKDYAVCRECGARIAHLDRHIAKMHTMLPCDYRDKWLGAPIYPPAVKKSNRVYAMQRRKMNPQEFNRKRREQRARVKAAGGQKRPEDRISRDDYREVMHNLNDALRGLKLIRGGKPDQPARSTSLLPERVVAESSSTGRGRKATKTPQYIEAEQLYDQIGNWSLVAKKVVPLEYNDDPNAAGNRLRLGVAHLKMKREKAKHVQLQRHTR